MFSIVPVIEKDGVKVMSSIDLALLCVGDSKDSHSNFMKKATKVLGELVVNFYEQQTYNKNGNGAKGTRNILMLPEREACLMAMSYSYELQAHVFDEWQKAKKPKPVTERDQLLLMAQTVIQQQEEIKLLEETKAHIGSKREATLMNKASQDAKTIKKLEDKLQDVGEYQSVIAAGLPQRVETELNPKALTWRVLTSISKTLNCEIHETICPRWGKAKTYHVKVIQKFKEDYLD